MRAGLAPQKEKKHPGRPRASISPAGPERGGKAGPWGGVQNPPVHQESVSVALNRAECKTLNRIYRSGREKVQGFTQRVPAFMGVAALHGRLEVC